MNWKKKKSGKNSNAHERIRQLAEQARKKPMGDSWCYVTLAEFEQKFAELIVQECAEIADQERSNSLGCGYITRTKGMMIKQHFGVDE